MSSSAMPLAIIFSFKASASAPAIPHSVWPTTITSSAPRLYKAAPIDLIASSPTMEFPAFLTIFASPLLRPRAGSKKSMSLQSIQVRIANFLAAW